MIIPSDFKPAWWLKSPHLQTLYGSVLRPHPKIRLRHERFELLDGDFLDLNWAIPSYATRKTPIVVILHGLGGSIESHYAQNIMFALYKAGWRALFMHYRGCSGVPNRKPHCYHSGYTSDVAFLVAHLTSRFPDAAIAAVGYSLGGNILLKWLTQTKEHNPLKTAVAISVPFELAKAADRINTGFSRLYQWKILRALKRYVRNKFSVIKSPVDLTHLDNIHTFWELDHYITAPLHGFDGVMEYYQMASCRYYLKTIAIPTLIIQAKDDPFMPPNVIPTEEELSNSTTLELSDHGGHVGFISGSSPGKPEYWLDKRVVEYLSRYFPQVQEKPDDYSGKPIIPEAFEF